MRNQNSINDEEVYSDSDDCRFSQDLEEQERKKKSIHSESIKNAHDIYSAQSLLRDSGINGISMQKHKYVNKIKSISNQIQLKDMSERVQSTLMKKQSTISSLILNNYSNQDDAASSINHPQNRTSQAIDKKQRNKQSAKMSRDRKKLYIEMLEEKQKALNKKLLSKKKELQQTKNYLDRVVNQNKAMSGFTASRHQMIKNLQSVLQNKDLTLEQKNQQINKIIDNLRYRIGSAGKQRVNTINQYFRQIVNLSMPALHRYMMWSATQEKHLFSLNQEEQTDQWYKELKNSLNLTQQQKQHVFKKKQYLKEQKKVLQKLIAKLKSIKCQIEDKSIQLQDMIQQIRGILTPIQCANFVIFIEKNKYRKQLNLCEQLEQDSKQKIKTFDSQGYESSPRKIVKTD